MWADRSAMPMPRRLGSLAFISGWEQGAFGVFAAEV